MSTPRGSSGGSRFWKWLQAVAPYKSQMAWCHTTDGYWLREIVESGFLAVNRCEVFEEDLLYLFYGRPAYRFKDESAMKISGRSPVVFILKPELLDLGSRLFPFDTGAFAAKRYKPWMHEQMEMTDFELECPSDAPQRHVASFFGTNDEYLRLRARTPAEPFQGEFEVDSMVALLTDKDADHADDRRIVIEMQTRQSVPLTSTYIKTILLPDEFLDAPWMKEFMGLEGKEIQYSSYLSSPLKQAREYQALLEDRAAQLQRGWGFV